MTIYYHVYMLSKSMFAMKAAAINMDLNGNLRSSAGYFYQMDCLSF